MQRSVANMCESSSDEIRCIDIYVNGDGGTWSCVNSVLYQIPTEIFNEYMMLGRLNDKEDLDALVEKICLEKPVVSELYGYTDIWVGVGGNWSGLPSMHFRLPSDVFEYLVEKGNTEKTIGRLVTVDDLTKLIEQTRFEIAHGPVESGQSIVRSKPTNTEVKGCGHTCTTSSLKTGCCACEDLRPIMEEGTYPMYIDGTGWVNQAMRGAGYCPYCYCV